MFKFKSLFVIIALAVSVLTGCNPDDTVTQPAIITSIKENLKPDSTDGWLYYSFDTDAAIPATQAGTDAWDIKFRFISNDTTPQGIGNFVNIFTRTGAIFLNSPTAGNPAGKTKGYLEDGAFTTVTAVGDDSRLRYDDTSTTTRIIPVQLSGATAYFIYANQTVSPNPQKTLVIMTKGGKYVKMQLQSMYQGKPAVPAKSDVVGYYSFQYVKSDTKSFK